MLSTTHQLSDGSAAFDSLEKAVQTIYEVTGNKEFRNEALAALYVGKRWLKHVFKGHVGVLKIRYLLDRFWTRVSFALDKNC